MGGWCCGRRLCSAAIRGMDGSSHPKDCQAPDAPKGPTVSFPCLPFLTARQLSVIIPNQVSTSRSRILRHYSTRPSDHQRTMITTIYPAQSLYLPKVALRMSSNLGHQPKLMRWLVDHRRIVYNCNSVSPQVVLANHRASLKHSHQRRPTGGK